MKGSAVVVASAGAASCAQRRPTRRGSAGRGQSVLNRSLLGTDDHILPGADIILDAWRAAPVRPTPV